MNRSRFNTDPFDHFHGKLLEGFFSAKDPRNEQPLFVATFDRFSRLFQQPTPLGKLRSDEADAVVLIAKNSHLQQRTVVQKVWHLTKLQVSDIEKDQ